MNDPMQRPVNHPVNDVLPIQIDMRPWNRKHSRIPCRKQVHPRLDPNPVEVRLSQEFKVALSQGQRQSEKDSKKDQPSPLRNRPRHQPGPCSMRSTTWSTMAAL